MGNTEFSITDNPIGGGTTGLGSITLGPGETVTFTIAFTPEFAGLSKK